MKRLAAGGVLIAMVALGVPALAADRPAGIGDHSDNTMARCPTGTQDCPTADAFYHPPARLAALRDGTVVRTRPTTIAEPGVSPKSSYQVAYRSQDAFGHAVMDVATVLVPTQQYAGSRPRPLVSLQFAIDSLGAQCVPSYDLTHPGANTGIDLVAQTWLSAFLAQGYVVVAADHEGPAEQFVVGQQEGHAVLDAIRAAESLPATGLSRRSPVALTGYSGGAHATGWASELAATYAPEVKIVGAAVGGTPASIPAVADYLNGSSNFGYAIFAIEAYRRAFPAEGIPRFFNAAGRQLLAEVRTMCVSTLDSHGGASNSGPNPDFKTFDDYARVHDVHHLPQFQQLMRYESLGQRAPRFPVFDYQAYNDEIIPATQSAQLAAFYCAHRVPVQFSLLQGEHETGLVEGAPQLFAFIRDRFAGAAPLDDCSTVIPAAAALPQSPQLTLPAT